MKETKSTLKTFLRSESAMHSKIVSNYKISVVNYLEDYQPGHKIQLKIYK